MIQTTLDREITLSLPDGFINCTKEDLKLQNDSKDLDWWAVRDTERHIIIIARWRRYSAFALKLTTPEKMIRANEQQTSQIMQGNGYQLKEFFSSEVGGKKAEGFRYSYIVEGQEQAVECVLIRVANCIYNISFYTRPENSEADREFIDTLLGSVKIG